MAPKSRTWVSAAIRRHASKRMSWMPPSASRNPRNSPKLSAHRSFDFGQPVLDRRAVRSGRQCYCAACLFTTFGGSAFVGLLARVLFVEADQRIIFGQRHQQRLGRIKRVLPLEDRNRVAHRFRGGEQRQRRERNRGGTGGLQLGK